MMKVYAENPDSFQDEFSREFEKVTLLSNPLTYPMALMTALAGLYGFGEAQMENKARICKQSIQ